MVQESTETSDDKHPDEEGHSAGDELALLKREIDALKIAYNAQHAPWYKNPSTLISIVALAFSFGTTFVSYVRTHSQDIQSSRVELRGLLQRLAAMPRENVEAAKKFGPDAAALAAIGSSLNQENALLARQAAEIAGKIPSEYVSATEYYAIAVALQSAYNLDSAKALFTKAIDVAKDMNDRVAGLRSRASLLFTTGQPNAGRVDYQRALNVFAEFGINYDEYTKKSTHIWTELQWAFSEAGIGSRDTALQHIASAENYLSGLIPSPGADLLRNQVLQAKSMIFASGPPGQMPGGTIGNPTFPLGTIR
ncbi:MAG: hypothetical protein ACXWND_15690 [Gemmatimonadaceae bacterium]